MADLSAPFLRPCHCPPKNSPQRSSPAFSRSLASSPTATVAAASVLPSTSTPPASSRGSSTSSSNGKQTNIGLGKYPAVSLSAARAKALDNIRLVRRGGDPRRRGKAAPTVIEIVEKIIARDAPTWRNPERTARDWRDAFRLYAADLSLRPVDEVTSAECTAVLGAIWNHHRSTASKLRQRLAAAFKLVVAEGYRSDNPVDAGVRNAATAARRRAARAPPRGRAARRGRDRARRRRRVPAHG